MEACYAARQLGDPRELDLCCWCGSSRCRLVQCTQGGRSSLAYMFSHSHYNNSQWVTSEAGSSHRLPPRGPITPALNSTLILITQDHRIQICVLLPMSPHVKFATASLLHAGTTAGSDTSPATTEQGGMYVCTNAVVGTNYGGKSCTLHLAFTLINDSLKIHRC